MKRRDFLALAGATLASPAWASDATALAEDLPLLKRIYETLHPGLYRYQTPAQWDAACVATASRLKSPADVGQQYLALAGLMSRVRCGHTYGNFFNQSQAIARRLVDPANKLPFHFAWLGPRIFVTDNPLGIDGLERGTEILSINGARAAEIQARLLPYIRADGGNDGKRRALLDVRGVDRIETFDVFHPLLFPSESARFKLTVARPGHGPQTVAVAVIDQAARRAMMVAGNDPSTSDYWNLTWPEPKVALITMPGWALYNQDWDWRARLDDMFAQIASRGANGLVIDLRDNEGGEDCGNEIIARLIDTDMSVSQDYERRVRFRSTPADLNPYLDTWDRSFEHLGEGALDIGNGFYRLADDEPGAGFIAPKGPRFRGKVAVLSSAQNSSATFQFISVMQRSGLGRIYGQTTGGNQRGINGGSFFFVRLPHSGLECDLPLVGFFSPRALPDAGLLPDVAVEAQPADLATGYDRVLARALADLA